MGRPLPCRSRPDLASLTDLPGPFATAVVPDLHDDGCRDRLGQELARSGAPARVRAALDEAVGDPYGPEVTALGAVAVEAGVVHLEAWPEAPVGEVVRWDAVPALTGFVLAGQRERPHLLVRVRAGLLDVLATGAAHLHLDLETDDEGRPTVRPRSSHTAPRVTRVPGSAGAPLGGPAAAEVERAAAQVGAEAIVVIGAPEEVEELAEALPPERRSSLYGVEPGPDPVATDEAVAETLGRAYEEANRLVLDTWSEAHAAGAACGGLASTLDALREGRVATVLLERWLLDEVGASAAACDLGLPPERCEELPERVSLADALVGSGLSAGADVWLVEGSAGSTVGDGGSAIPDGTGAIFVSGDTAGGSPGSSGSSGPRA